MCYSNREWMENAASAFCPTPTSSHSLSLCLVPQLPRVCLHQGPLPRQVRVRVRVSYTYKTISEISHGLLLIPSSLCWNVTHFLKPTPRKRTNLASVSLLFWAYIYTACTWDIADQCFVLFTAFHTQLQQKINVDKCLFWSGQDPSVHDTQRLQRGENQESSQPYHIWGTVSLHMCTRVLE